MHIYNYFSCFIVAKFTASMCWLVYFDDIFEFDSVTFGYSNKGSGGFDQRFLDDPHLPPLLRPRHHKQSKHSKANLLSGPSRRDYDGVNDLKKCPSVNNKKWIYGHVGHSNLKWKLSEHVDPEIHHGSSSEEYWNIYTSLLAAFAVKFFIFSCRICVLHSH